MASSTVKFQSVTLQVTPWKHPSGRDYFRAIYHTADGKRHAITRSTLAKAKDAALRKAVELSKGTTDFNALSPHQLRAIRRLLDVDPSLSLVDDFLAWRSKKLPTAPTAPTVAEFIALKEQNAGLSTQNVRTLRKHLQPLANQFGTAALASITVQQLEAFLSANPKNGNRTRKNIRASLVTFFRWARQSEYLHDEKTAAEKTGTPIVGYKTPETYQPEELAIMLAAVRPEFFPWLAIAAFAGLRTDEISPIAGSRKSPLAWEDFKWDRDLIIVRPETAKTKRRRVIPIHSALRAWLYPVKKDSGPVHAAAAPTKRGKGAGAMSETSRLGKLVGGWRPNALRDSYISYRAALVGLGQTAMEAGNSEAEAKASYNDAKGADEAAKWFGVQPPSSPVFYECSQNPSDGA